MSFFYVHLQLLEIRNSLFHSGNFLVANPKLQADMQTMLAFLRGLTALSGVEQSAVDEAIDKILQVHIYIMSPFYLFS